MWIGLHKTLPIKLPNLTEFWPLRVKFPVVGRHWKLLFTTINHVMGVRQVAYLMPQQYFIERGTFAISWINDLLMRASRQFGKSTSQWLSAKTNRWLNRWKRRRLNVEQVNDLEIGDIDDLAIWIGLRFWSMNKSITWLLNKLMTWRMRKSRTKWVNVSTTRWCSRVDAFWGL